MDILWPAIGISIIVGFVLYVLAGHWGRVLRQQAWTIRRLSDRVHTLEEMDDPRFRERLNEAIPAPLEQVLTFSLRFSDRFWRETLHLSEGDWDFVRGFGSFVGSVKIERWRSHIVAKVTEVLPGRQEAAWQTRSLDYYPGPEERSEPLILWELPLARPASGQQAPLLKLALRRSGMELRVHLADPPAAHGPSETEETLFFHAPFDPAPLATFRGHDPAEIHNGNGDGNPNRNDAPSWRSFYAWEDRALGIEWQLRVLDLNLKTEWERWKILEPAAPQVTSKL